MISFIFEQYGYYPKEIQDNVFTIGEWIFKLVEIEEDEAYIQSVEEYIANIRNQFSNARSFVIKSRTGKSITMYDGKRYVLISVKKCQITFKEMEKFHKSFEEGNSNINLKKLALTWEEKLSYIEKNAVSSFRIDSIYYSENLQKSMYIFGETVNAIQYLSELVDDFGGTLDKVSITHKRLRNLDSFNFYNPFNFIIDNPVRDIIYLYKNDFVEFEILIELLGQYDFDTKLATYTMARYMYPCDALDSLEENIGKNNASFSIKYNIEKEYCKCKKLYDYLKMKYKIRPINWLEN